MSGELRRRGNVGGGESESEAKTTEPQERTGRRCCSRCTCWAAVAVLLIAAVFWALPCHIDPIAFRICKDGLRAFEGPLAINTVLKRAELLFPGELVKPEAFVRDDEGFIYTGLGDGRLVRLNPDLSHYTTILRVGQPPYDDCGSPAAEDHCGRVLGLHRHPSRSDILYAADSSFGLLEINIVSKEVKVLVPQRYTDDNGDTPFINFSNDLVVLANGSIFFTDSSKKYSRFNVVLEVFEGRPNGQLVHYNPVTRRAHVVVSELHFPNGMCLSHDGTALLITETTRARILRYHLTGSQAGSVDVFIDNLPGLPDNVTPNLRRDGYWVAFAATRKNALIDRITEFPRLRSLIVKLRLARTLVHSLPKHALVVELDSHGHITRSLHDEGGAVLQSISHVLDLGDRLLLGSYEAPHAAVVPLD